MAAAFFGAGLLRRGELFLLDAEAARDDFARDDDFFRATGLREVAFFFAEAFREAPARAARFAVFFLPLPVLLLEALRADFFLATLILLIVLGSGPFVSRFPFPVSRPAGKADHTIPNMSNRDGERVRITPLPSGVRVEIRPLVRRRRDRIRLLLVASLLVAAAFFGGARLASAWESTLRKGDASELPLPVLALLSLAVGVSTPLALVGLAALAFAEETVEVESDEIVIRTQAFERTTVRRIRREDLECWRETLLPLPPWWTWAVERLAARSGGHLTPIAGMAGPREKRRIARALARATGKPLVKDFGRRAAEFSGGSVC